MPVASSGSVARADPQRAIGRERRLARDVEHRIARARRPHGLPLLEVGLVGFSAVIASDGSNARTLDDAVPILETVALSGLAVQAIKLTVGRERPFVHLAPPGATHDPDDDLSFLSGHSALAFGVATAAGVTRAVVIDTVRGAGYRLRAAETTDA